MLEYMGTFFFFSTTIRTHHESMSLFSTKNRHKINAFAVPSDMCGRVVSVKQ